MMIAPVKNRRNLLARKRGQGMTEYIIIVALIAIAAIGVITLFGDNIRRLFGASTEALAGNTNVEAKTQNRKEDLEKKRNLNNFGMNNGY